jgi:glycosyltransferase involved in cell wall biosynthesis
MSMQVNKRILFFIETGGPGGAEQVVYQLAKAWRERGCEVAVATVRTGWLTERLSADGITHVHLPSEKGFDLSLPWRLAKLARNYDVLHAHLFDSNVYGLIAARLAGISFVGTEHGDIHHIDQRKLSGIKFLLLRLLRGKITAVSQFTRQACSVKAFQKMQSRWWEIRSETSNSKSRAARFYHSVYLQYQKAPMSGCMLPITDR